VDEIALTSVQDQGGGMTTEDQFHSGIAADDQRYQACALDQVPAGSPTRFQRSHACLQTKKDRGARPNCSPATEAFNRWGDYAGELTELEVPAVQRLSMASGIVPGTRCAPRNPKIKKRAPGPKGRCVAVPTRSMQIALQRLKEALGQKRVHPTSSPDR
jgi:hypothetical protein